jgi:hypothetical protein
MRTRLQFPVLSMSVTFSGCASSRLWLMIMFCMCMVVVDKEQHRHMIRHSRACLYVDDGDGDDADTYMATVMMLAKVVMMVHGEDDDVQTTMWCMMHAAFV